MYEVAASCKEITRAPVPNREPQCVTLTGYCHAVRHEKKVQLVTSYRVTHSQRYGVTERGNVIPTSTPLLHYVVLQPTTTLLTKRRLKLTPFVKVRNESKTAGA
jgi:hypothetical protein